MSNFLGTTELGLAARSYMTERGVAEDDPIFSGRFTRRVVGLVTDGQIEAQRMGGRWFVRADLVPQVAQLMGFRPNKNPSAASNG